MSRAKLEKKSTPLGNAIRALRTALKRSLKQFAGDLDVQIMVLQRWESGQTVPKNNTLRRLAEMAIDQDLKGEVVELLKPIAADTGISEGAIALGVLMSKEEKDLSSAGKLARRAAELLKEAE